MYSRDVAGRVRRFEPSGSLYHSALVMQDDATDSYWAVVSSEAIGGTDRGTRLEHLPISEKTTWGDWQAKHPDTVVLSVDGVEDISSNPYENYFASDDTFRNSTSADQRLSDKEPVFAFHLAERPFAVPHKDLSGGWQGDSGHGTVFLYRPQNASIYRSTAAYRLEGQGASSRLEKRDGVWFSPELGRFDPESGVFENAAGSLPALDGIDTFWYVWSNYYPRTLILEPASR